MNQTLNSLRDIHLPPPVGWFPPAPGWWLLGALLLIAALSGLWAWRRRTRLRRRSLRHLHRLHATWRKDRDDARYLRGLSRLLRQAAIAAHPEGTPAGLTGESWLAFLDHHGRTRAFTAGIGRTLLTAPYQARPQADVEALHRLARHWLETATVPRRRRGA